MHRARPAAVAIMFLLAACGQQGSPAGSTAQAATPQSTAPSRAEAAKAAPLGGRGLPANALRVQTVEIMDRAGFEQPLAAATGLVPLGWKASGGIEWGQQFVCTNGYNIAWAAVSPDGMQAIGVLPQRRWESNNYGAPPGTPGCTSAQIQSAQQYLTQLAAGLRQGARVTGYRPRADIAAKYAQLNSRTPSATGEMRTWVEAGEAQFAYTDKGREMRGVVSGAVIFSLSRMNGMGMGSMDALTGFALPAFAATAPEAVFKPELIEAIRQSFLPNPAWEARISQHNSALSQVAQQENAKRSRIIAETSDYVSRIRRETADLRSQSDEHRQREFSEAIRGTEHYADPDAPGGTVELSGLYDNAWRLSDGTYVLSGDAGFEPGRDLGIDGKRLAPAK